MALWGLRQEGSARPRSGRRGFSLSECLVALLILSLLSVVLVGVVPSTVFGMKSAENRARATCMARDLLDGIYATGGEEGETTLPPRTVNGTTYGVTVAVRPVRDVPGPVLDSTRIQHVSITVTWVERRATKRHILSTYCYRP